MLLLRGNTVLVAALQLCSKSLTSSLSDCNVWDNPHVPCGKNTVRTPALLPSRAERDELKWLISIIWLVQLHKHEPILASVSVFLLECATLALMHQTVYPARSIFMPSTLLLWMARFISTLVRVPRPCVCRLQARGGSRSWKNAHKKLGDTDDIATVEARPQNWARRVIKEPRPAICLKRKKEKRHFSNIPGTI